MAGFMRISRLLVAGSFLVLSVPAGAQGLQDAHRDHTPPLDDARTAKPDAPATTATPVATPVKTGIVARGVSRPKETQPTKSSAKGKTKAAVPISATLPEPTPEQPVILRPSQMPAVAPRISYEGGLLTIVASNSTLADIFAGIRNVTGVKIETTGGPSGERVAAKIGPAPLRNVLLSLLQGARYDYIILGSVQDAEKVERVILTPKLAGGTQATTAASSQPLRQPEPDLASESADPEDNSGGATEDENEGFAPAGQPAQPGGQVPADQQGQPQPGQLQPGQAQPGTTQPNPNGTPKTPEQLLEDLKRLEQERQQQNQPGQRDDRGERPR
jgi:hypothetical protein